MNDGLPIKNHIAPDSVFKKMNLRRDEIRAILRNCAIDGCTSIEHIRYELAQQLHMGSIYNLTTKELEHYIKGVGFTL